MTNKLKNSIFQKIGYSTCWEDPSIIQKALKIEKGDRVLSISSSGCNILNFLLHDPKEILAVDYDPNQQYLLELKIKAIKNLNYREFLAILGVTPSDEREEIYSYIRDSLEHNTRIFWDNKIELIKKGILYNGEIERYAKIFGKYLCFLKGEKVIKQFFKCETIKEQSDYFYKNIHSMPYILFLILEYNKYIFQIRLSHRLFSEFLVKRKKPSDEDFIFIKKNSYSTDYLKKIEYVFTNMPIKNNYFASLVLLGYYIDEECYPSYLKSKYFSLLKKRVNRIKIKNCSLKKALISSPNKSIDKFNLSNVLDWVNIKEFRKHLEIMSKTGRPGSSFCYFSTRFDRGLPKDIKYILQKNEKAEELLKKSRTWGYEKFEIGTFRN